MKVSCRQEASTGSIIMVLTDMRYDKPMSELGKGRDIDMNLYHLLKPKMDLGSDIPQGLRECTPVEIKNSVVQTGSHEALASGSSLIENI